MFFESNNEQALQKSLIKDRRQWIHFSATAILLLAGYPLCRAAMLQVSGPVSLLRFVPAIAAQGISIGAILFALQYPKVVAEALKSGDRRRFLLLLPVFGLLFYLYHPVNAGLFSVGALATAEYFSSKRRCAPSIMSVLLPAAYFLFGFGLVYKFNDIIATFRFYGTCDSSLLRIDRWLLFGGTVFGMSNWVQVHNGKPIFSFLEAIYYGTFAQVGAAIILCGLGSGLTRALRLVGTILLSYYLTLVCFFLWPSHGPYLLCPEHFQTFPKNLNSYAVQQIFLANVKTLWNHTSILASTGGYYISFPCMHITQPVIVLWFLRPYRRIVKTLIAYDLVLIPAILLLEWHYAIDIVGGIIVAVVVICLSGDEGTAEHRTFEANPEMGFESKKSAVRVMAQI